MTTQLLASARSSYVLSYEVVATHPHDHSSFTQGLTFDRNSTLYESVGLYGESDVRTVDLASGAALRRTANAPEVFGEGLALAGDALIQLSWRENKAMLSSPGFEVVVREATMASVSMASAWVSAPLERVGERASCLATRQHLHSTTRGRRLQPSRRRSRDDFELNDDRLGPLSPSVELLRLLSTTADPQNCSTAVPLSIADQHAQAAAHNFSQPY